MVVRHHQIDFVPGALVFPGGKADAADFDAGLDDRLDGAAADPDLKALQVASIREAFEECGVLLARRAGALVDGDEAWRLTETYRARLEHGEVSMAEIARAEGLTLAADLMIPFAHWVTPGFMKKRFDTHFFIVAAPEGHALSHDGGEAVDANEIRALVAELER